MTSSQTNISSETARRILFEAKKTGVSVENYLENAANAVSESCYKDLTVKNSAINYDFADARQWMKNNSQKYIGKWVVLDGKKLIGVGSEPVSLVEKARKEGVKIPFVQFINDNSKPFMGGWL